VSILLGNGDRTFQPQVTYVAGVNPFYLIVSDFNADGKPDLAVADAFGATIDILLGNGDGTFQPQVTYAVGSHPKSIAEGYFNGDGIPDLAVANVNSNNMSVLLGNGNGTFKTQVTYAVGTTPEAVAVADLNGNGNVDVVVGNNGTATASVFLNLLTQTSAHHCFGGRGPWLRRAPRGCYLLRRQQLFQQHLQHRFTHSHTGRHHAHVDR
jgi:hypothetical protein